MDIIALSFVRKAQDIIQCKKLISTLGSEVPVVAKVEKLSAIQHIDSIAQEADGLMVARGDLGVEGEVFKVPTFQKNYPSSNATLKTCDYCNTNVRVC